MFIKTNVQKDFGDKTGFLPEQIWVRLPDPTDLPLLDLKILGKNLTIWGEKIANLEN